MTWRARGGGRHFPPLVLPRVCRMPGPDAGRAGRTPNDAGPLRPVSIVAPAPQIACPPSTRLARANASSPTCPPRARARHPPPHTHHIAPRDPERLWLPPGGDPALPRPVAPRDLIQPIIVVCRCVSPPTNKGRWRIHNTHRDALRRGARRAVRLHLLVLFGARRLHGSTRSKRVQKFCLLHTTFVWLNGYKPIYCPIPIY